MLTRTLIVASLVSAASAEAACPKWNSNINPCTIYPELCVDKTFYTLSFGKRFYLAGQQFSFTPEEACDKLWNAYAKENSYAQAWWPTRLVATNDPDIKSCQVKWDNLTWWDNGSHVTLQSVGEPECTLTPKGPYTNPDRDFPRPSVVATPGAGFSSKNNTSKVTPSTRGWILEKNFQRLGGYGSDLEYDDVPAVKNAMTFEPYHDDPVGNDPPIMPDWDGSLQIDHLIPRVDVYSCPCGTNGYNNALVISGELNRDMLNDLRHPQRIAILQQYVPGYVAPQRAAFDDPHDNEAPVEETGGCSTSRASGMFGVLAILGAVLFRRRRASLT